MTGDDRRYGNNVGVPIDDEKQFYVRNSASSQPYDMSEAVEYINKHWTK